MSSEREIAMSEEETPVEPFDLNKHTARLLMDEPFFAALSRQIDKRASTAIPTAGVRVNPDTARLEMIYNPEFFANMPDDHKRGILLHEFYHLVFEHVGKRLPSEGMSERWNWCTDLAINGLLRRNLLPEFALYPGEGHFEHLPAGKSAEWYMANLTEEDMDKIKKEAQKEQGEGKGKPNPNGESMGSLDDHGEWGEAGAEGDASTETEIAKQRIKEALKKATEEAARGSSWGSVPAETRKRIMDSLKTTIDWKKALRYFVKTSQRSRKRSTIKRINRRYAYVHPGRRTERVANLLIAIDQSGSVSDSMLASFFSCLEDLAKIATFTILPFDTVAHEDKLTVWKKGQAKVWERVSMGGTCFNAPTDFVNAHSDEYDGMIILTDMEAPKPKPCAVKRMWGTDERGYSRPYFQTNELVLKIEGE